jgi:hypothetical protein
MMTHKRFESNVYGSAIATSSCTKYFVDIVKERFGHFKGIVFCMLLVSYFTTTPLLPILQALAAGIPL